MTRLLTLVLTLAAAAPAQIASITPFGTACGQVPSVIATVGLPRPGSAVTFTHSPMTSSGMFGSYTTWLALGFPQTSWAGGPLPWPVPAWMTNPVSGCTLYVAPDVVVQGTQSPATNDDRVVLAIPNNPGLLGVTFDAQWLPTQFRFTMMTIRYHLSSAMRLVVGN